MKDLIVKVTLVDEMLGTSNPNADIHEKYIASLAPDAASKKEEVEALGVSEVIENAMTVFPKLADGTPFVWNYQVKGFFKDSCSALQRCGKARKKKADGDEAAAEMIAMAGDVGVESGKLTAYKKVIDGNVFVFPRKLKINIPEGGRIGNCQRALRAQTAQGERNALANSETVPRGSYLFFKVRCLDDKLAPAVLEWLDFGIYRGMLQWRNSGKGSFVYEAIDPETKRIIKSNVNLDYNEEEIDEALFE